MSDYYVNYNFGLDSNPGTEEEPWKTIDKVNAESAGWSGGDAVYFARGMNHYGQITPGASGSSGNPIIFGAYGSGSPAVITPLFPVYEGWSLYDTNVYRCAITGGINYVCMFNGVKGILHTAIGNISNKYDFYYGGGYLYVYAESDPGVYYDSVDFLRNYYSINVVGRNYLRFQHLYCQDYHKGALVKNAIEVELIYLVCRGGLSASTDDTIGIQLSACTDTKIYNVDLISNRYNLYASAGSGCLLKNSRLYAGYTYNMYDVGGSEVTYSNNHFYAGSCVNASILGHGIKNGIDGGNNILISTSPNIVDDESNPPYMMMRIDDFGMQGAGLLTWVDGFRDSYISKNLPLTLGVVAGQQYASAQASWLSDRLAEGHIIASHAWSHQNYLQAVAFNIQYVGAGSACTLTISGNTFSTSVTGGPGGEDLNIDLTNASYNSFGELIAYIDGLSAYTCTAALNLREEAHSITIADVAGQDIKTAVHGVLFDKQRLVEDELTASKTWLESNISGLTTCRHYMWPGTYWDEDTAQWCYEAGYKTGGGGVSNKQRYYHTLFNAYGIIGQALNFLNGESESVVKQTIREMAFAHGVFSFPVQMYLHRDQLSVEEMIWIAEELESLGVSTDLDDLETYIYAGEQVTDTWLGRQRGDIDLRHTNSSPCRDAGEDLGLLEDIVGLSVPQETNPTIGAYEWFALTTTTSTTTSSTISTTTISCTSSTSSTSSSSSSSSISSTSSSTTITIKPPLAARETVDLDSEVARSVDLNSRIYPID